METVSDFDVRTTSRPLPAGAVDIEQRIVVVRINGCEYSLGIEEAKALRDRLDRALA